MLSNGFQYVKSSYCIYFCGISREFKRDFNMRLSCKMIYFIGLKILYKIIYS